MIDVTWPEARTVRAIHLELVAEHGGIGESQIKGRLIPRSQDQRTCSSMASRPAVNLRLPLHSGSQKIIASFMEPSESPWQR